MIRTRLPLALILFFVAGCDRGAAAGGKGPKNVVARVNGKPITSEELELRQVHRGRSRGGAERAEAESREQALDALVLQELQAQRALELGLDADESFQRAQQRAEAQLREARRRELAKLYRSKEVLEKTVVSEEEARQYFAANEGRIRTELRVLQILISGLDAAHAAAAELAAGKPFEEVAAARHPNLPADQKPWVLPVLGWEQIPSQWWEPLDPLQPGEVSGPIAGPDGQYWILKLLERTRNAKVTFELALPRVQALVKSLKFEQRRAQLEKELRSGAKIERVAPPAPAP